MKVIQVFRKRKNDFFSIERVYESINPYLDREIEVSEIEVKASAANLASIFSNWNQLRKVKGDMYHVTGEINYTALFFPAKQVVLTLHDCNFVKKNKGIKGQLIKLFWLTLPVKHCSRVIAISEATKTDIVQLTGCDPDKIIVIPNPVPALFKPVKNLDDKEVWQLLQVGTRWNKNVDRVLEAIVGLPCKLTIIGKLNKGQQDYITKNYLQTEEVNNLDEHELVEKYAQSDIVVFASLSEGFGLPILEAQASGKPVITSNIEPMQSVSGGAALLVDPHSVAEIRDAINLLINDSSRRNTLTEAGLVNAAAYRPKAIAEKYASLYRSLVK